MRLAWIGGGCALVATLGASAAPASASPPNDDFERAAPLAVGTTVTGTLRGATARRGDPRYGRTASVSVWYRLRATRTRTLRLSTCHGGSPHAIVVFRGRSIGTLRAVARQGGGCRRGAGGADLVFTTRRGRLYRIAVVGSASEGPFRLTIAPVVPPPNDDFASATPIALGSSLAATTRDATREPGEPAHSYGGAQTVWFRVTTAADTEVRLDACNGDRPYVAVYAGARVDRLARLFVANACIVQFAAHAGESYRVALESAYGGGAFRLSARAATPPANDDFARATPITLGTTVNGTTREAGREPGEPPGYYGHPFTVWYRLTIAATTHVAFRRCTQGIGSLNAYTGSRLTDLESWLSFCAYTLVLRPGAYGVQVETRDETDFSFRPEIVPPRP